MDLVFARGEFFRAVGDQNESLRIILMYYMLKYSFRIKTSFARVTSEPKKPVKKLDLGKTSYKDLVFARGEFLSVVGAQNESPRIILMYYMLKY